MFSGNYGLQNQASHLMMVFPTNCKRVWIIVSNTFIIVTMPFVQVIIKSISSQNNLVLSDLKYIFM